MNDAGVFMRRGASHHRTWSTRPGRPAARLDWRRPRTARPSSRRTRPRTGPTRRNPAWAGARPGRRACARTPAGSPAGSARRTAPPPPACAARGRRRTERACSELNRASGIARSQPRGAAAHRAVCARGASRAADAVHACGGPQLLTAAAGRRAGAPVARGPVVLAGQRQPGGCIHAHRLAARSRRVPALSGRGGNDIGAAHPRSDDCARGLLVSASRSVALCPTTQAWQAGAGPVLEPCSAVLHSPVKPDQWLLKTCEMTAHDQALLLLACLQTGCGAVFVLQLTWSLTRPCFTVANKRGCHLCRPRSLRLRAPGRRCPGKCHPRRKSIPWQGIAPPPVAGPAPGPLLQRSSQQACSAGALALHPAMPRRCLQTALSVQGPGLRTLVRATPQASFLARSCCQDTCRCAGLLEGSYTIVTRCPVRLG